jgi:hypothetical protein
MSPVASVGRPRRCKSDQIEKLLGELGAKSSMHSAASSSLHKPPVAPRTLVRKMKLWPGAMPLPPSIRELDSNNNNNNNNNNSNKINEEINHSRRTGHGAGSKHDVRRGSDSGARSAAMDPFEVNGVEEENGTNQLKHSFLVDWQQQHSDMNPAAADNDDGDGHDHHHGLDSFVQSRKEGMCLVLDGISSNSENMSSNRRGKMRRPSSLPASLARQAAPAAAASRRVGEGVRQMAPQWASSTMATASTRNKLGELLPEEWETMHDVFREIKTYDVGRRRSSLNGRGSAHPPLSPSRHSSEAH